MATVDEPAGRSHDLDGYELIPRETRKVVTGVEYEVAYRDEWLGDAHSLEEARQLIVEHVQTQLTFAEQTDDTRGASGGEDPAG